MRNINLLDRGEEKRKWFTKKTKIFVADLEKITANKRLLFTAAVFETNDTNKFSHFSSTLSYFYHFHLPIQVNNIEDRKWRDRMNEWEKKFIILNSARFPISTHELGTIVLNGHNFYPVHFIQEYYVKDTSVHFTITNGVHKHTVIITFYS